MKIIVISGTPGTGKTTIANFISTKINSIAISLSESVVREKLYNNYDDERKTFILNQKKVINYVRKIIKESSTPIQIDHLSI
jgi:adenylate kinase